MTTKAGSKAKAQQRVDVTAVLADITIGETLRTQIADLQKRLKEHEDIIKDALGTAVEGVDSTGRIVVRYPIRNRTGLDKQKVKDYMDATEYAECETVTTYRTLLYGDGA